MRRAPSTKSVKRSLGPVDGPTGSYEVPSAGPAGPVCPEWLKYGPIDRITGVLASAGSALGRRTSACSFVPSGSVIVASVHVAPGGTAAACAAPAGSATPSTSAINVTRRRSMNPPTHGCPEPCGHPRGQTPSSALNIPRGGNRLQTPGNSTPRGQTPSCGLNGAG